MGKGAYRPTTESTSLFAMGILLLGLGFAAAVDLRLREVPDWVWQFLGGVGAILGFLSIGLSSGPLGIALWALASGFVLQHFFDWGRYTVRRSTSWAPAIDVAMYALAISVVIFAIGVDGLGSPGVPVIVVATVANAILVRCLFEARALWGGADAKALMAAGLVVPLFGATLLGVPSVAAGLSAVTPFAISILVNGLVLSIGVPVGIAVWNLRRGEFSWRTGFTTYRIPVAALPSHHVWVRDPIVPGEDEVPLEEGAREDAQYRAELSDRLEARGIRSIRVSPQVPLVAFFAAGAVVALLAGNLAWDIAAVL